MRQALVIPEFTGVEEWTKRESPSVRRACLDVLRHEVELFDGSMRIDGVLRLVSYSVAGKRHHGH